MMTPVNILDTGKLLFLGILAARLQIILNPPYSLKWDANPKYLDDPRYSGVGKLAPKSHADLAFVQHMVYHMDEQDGRVAVLLPHGVLFRGGAEEDIRKYLIRDLNRVDA